MENLDFDLIRPYNSQEVAEAVPRIIKDKAFHLMMDYLFSNSEKQEIIKNTLASKDINEFQIALTLPSVVRILERTSDGVSSSGFENLNNDTGYAFVANHRDIVLDSSILGLVNHQHGYMTPQITWGNNLMVSPLIVDLGKSNQMITVFREGSPKEMLLNSTKLSAYIKDSIINKHQSVWIAHRKGRAKNGCDCTDVSILKMLSLYGKEKITEKLASLNITPTTISYEWEPCDAMKTREIYMSKDHNYIKAEDEDFMSIIGGLTGYKGRINITMGTPIDSEILDIETDNLNNNGLLDKISALIDKQMYLNYKLWPSNYLAWDILNDSNTYSDMYSDDTKMMLEKRLKAAYEHIGLETQEIKDIFLHIYANPLINKTKIEEN